MEDRYYCLPLGSITPTGWYASQLRLQADNNTGIIGRYWPDLGDNSGWLGGTGESWERGPYYVDGLIPLAFLLQDESLLSTVRRWISWVLKSQRDNGDFGPVSCDDPWPKMVMLKALSQYYEATQDSQVLEFCKKYLCFIVDWLEQNDLWTWGYARGYELLWFVEWYTRMTNNPTERCIDRLKQAIVTKSLHWEQVLLDYPYTHSTAYYHPWKIEQENHPGQDLASELWFQTTHSVNVSMGVKAFDLVGRMGLLEDPSVKLQTALHRMFSYHGVANGMWTGSEHLAGNDPSQGTELCTIVELMFSLEQSIHRFPEDFAVIDILERIAFNALPSSFSPDLSVHQYLQQVNQISVSKAPRPWYNNNDEANLFGLEPHFGCCTANLHQGWPKLASSFWFQHQDTLYAGVYAPNDATIRFSSGAWLTIEEETEYPFADTIRFHIHAGTPVPCKIVLRIPRWCEQPSCSCDGTNVERQGTCFSIERIWSEGDIVELSLPFSLRIVSFGPQGVGVYYGPLLMALPLTECWTEFRHREAFSDYEVTTTDTWNYALALSDIQTLSWHRLSTHSGSITCFRPEEAPFSIEVPAYRVTCWKEEYNVAGPVPGLTLEDIKNVPVENLRLIPYAFTRLQIAQFPYVCIHKEGAYDEQ